MFNIPPLLVHDGDSSRPISVADFISFKAQHEIVALNGRMLAECLANFADAVAPLRNCNAPLSAIVFHAPGGDLMAGKSAAATYSMFIQYVRLAHDQGWVIIATTLPPDDSLAHDIQLELRDYNRRLMENVAAADDVVDTARLAAGGDEVIARAVAAAVDRCWHARRVREKFVLFGEVQMLVIHRHLLAILHHCRSERLELTFIDSNDPRSGDHAADALGNTAALILQINPERPVLYETTTRLLSDMRGRPALLVPTVVCKSLWPFDEPEDFTDAPPGSTAAGTRGDQALRELVISGMEPMQAAADYAARDLAQRVDLDGHLAADIARWQSLDAVCDVKLAAFLQSEFRTHQLFHSARMPSNRVLGKLIARIGSFLNLTADEISVSEQAIASWELLQPDTPVHPSIMRHFDLAWGEALEKFDIFGHKVEYLTWAKDSAQRVNPTAPESGAPDAPDIRHALFKTLLEAKWERDRLEVRSKDGFLISCNQHFGASRAQLFQDIFVLWKFNFKHDGYFVEFGATDGRTINNSYLLEKEYGWTGLLCEPFPFWHADLAANRACRIDHRCVWSRSGETVEFWVDDKYPDIATIEQFKSADSLRSLREMSTRTIQVETISLNQLLDEAGAPADFDYLSVDTEGSELDILTAFDFARYAPKIITVEHNFNDGQRAQIHDLLSRHGYRREYEDLSRWDDWYVHQSLG